MRFKSFLGTSLADAMNQVRASLGDDAIIVATRDEDGPNGEKFVRVSAAFDDDPLPGSPAAKNNPAPVAAPEPEPEFEADEDVLDAVADTLSRHGTPPALAEKLVTACLRAPAADAATMLAAALSGALKFGALTDKTTRHVLLLGPPGAGKTAMVGKLAARAALAGQKVAIIATDLARAGGIAQLQAYTQSLKIPLLQVEDAHALPDALAAHATADLIFVDTMGRNPTDAADADEAKILIKGAGAGAQIILALPAGLEPNDGAELAAAFKALGATHLLTTRLDLARRLGSLLAVAHDSRLMICEASASPSIAAGLVALGAEALAARLLGQESHSHSEAVKNGNRRYRQTGYLWYKVTEMTEPTQLATTNDATPGAMANAATRLSARNVVAVASGKGGVGKTWLSITLSQALAKLGRKILLFDGDLGMANVDIQLGLMPEKDLGMVVDGKCTMAGAVTQYEEGDFSILAGRSSDGKTGNAVQPAGQ